MESKKIFDLISLHRWNDIISIIKNNKYIDLNIRDNSSYYLINYAIMFNNYNFVKLLIDKDCKLDIIDKEGHNIYYLPIKFNYINILELLLSKTKHIGLSLYEMYDSDGFYPIHHAVTFKNLDAIKLLAKYTPNINFENKSGDLPIHMAVRDNNYEIFEYLLKNTEDLNFQNNLGETIFHISANYGYDKISEKLVTYDINVNIQDYDNQVTPVMYLIILNNIKTFDNIFNKINFQMQDFNGNNVLHYCVLEDNKSLIDNIIEKNIDLNITNIYGKTVLHLIIENFEDSYLRLNLLKIFEGTNLNILDNEGNSIFFLICRNNLFDKLYDFLKGKKINYVLKNKKNQTATDYITKDKLDKFYELISDSYLNIIRSSNLKFNNNIYNICKNKISSNEFNKINKSLNIDFKIEEKGNDICKLLFRKLIEQSKLVYPKTIKNYCMDLSEFDKNVDFITFTGSTIDILFGIIYLKQSFKKVLTSVTKNFNINNALEKYYIENKNKTVRKEDFINFEIIWDGINLNFPTDIDSILNTFYKNNIYSFLVIPLGIELENGAHSNILILDKERNVIERFEPNGSGFPFNFNYNPKLLDNELFLFFKKYNSSLKYESPADYLPKIGFQILESLDKNKKIGDPGGFCAVWCIWYSYMRIKYNTLDSKILVLKLIYKIKEQNIEFKTLIRQFAKNIIDLRDKVLNKNNVDINDWINSTYDKDKFQNIIESIKFLT